jgi:arsenite methyltransferase
MSGTGRPLHQCPGFRAVAGEALRPGGLTLTDRLLGLAALPRGSRLLDQGCGPGLSARHAAGQWGLRVTGLDTNHADLVRSRARNASAAYIQADLNHPPLRPGTFDAVLCECVLTLQPDPKRMLSRLAALLKPEGLLLLTDLYLREPGSPPLWRSEPRGCLEGAAPRDEMERWLAEAGFTVAVFEDHSRLLVELTARLIFAGMDPRGRPGTSTGPAQARPGGKPGYCLILAARKVTEARTSAVSEPLR